MENQEKLGFFKRLKIAIFNLEDYGMFLGEPLSKAIKYLLLLTLLTSIILSLVSTFLFYRMGDRALNYVKNELPDFSYENGELKFNDRVEAYDAENEFRLFIDTGDDAYNKKLEEYKSKLYEDDYGLMLFKEKALIIYKDETFEEQYSTFSNNYGLNIKDKESLLNEFNKVSLEKIVLLYFIISLLASFITGIISIILDLIVIALFGYLAATFCKMRLKISTCCTLAIYSISLSVIINVIYGIVRIFTGFIIRHFDVMYLLISYVYMVAAIFIIRSDLIKQQSELQEIYRVQKEVQNEQEDENHEEKKEEKSKEEKKEKTKEEKDEDNSNNEPEIGNREPDGSEI